MDIPQTVSKNEAQVGSMGQQYLVTGKQVALRRWEEKKGVEAVSKVRDYETVGYLISGVLEIKIDDEIAKLKAEESWLVPAGAKHAYKIIDDIVAIEATSPPARFNERDE